MGTFSLVLFILGAVASTALAQRNTTVVTVQFDGSPLSWKHYWELSVGSCHATTTLRADWREHMKRARDELGFQYVRFHGLFDDDMSVVLGPRQFSWFNVDTIFDYLLSIGVRPFVELSFMPDIYRSSNTTIFHYKGNTSPPKNYQDWYDLITAFIKHMISRYGLGEVSQWYFEVWNEPNIDFWSGTQAQYFQLLETSYKAIKAVSPNLRVGGPATAQSMWLKETRVFAESKGLKLDFFSTHEYPSDWNSPPTRNNMEWVFDEARRELGTEYPLFYTEFNSGLDEPHHDDPFAAAFVINTVATGYGYVDAVSYWAVTDIFEEGGQYSAAFQQQFGIQTIHGVRKPVWRALELLHWTGKERLSTTWLSGAQSVSVLATRNSTHLALFAINYEWTKNPCYTEQLNLVVENVPAAVPSSAPVAFIIDSKHANPAATWRKQGAPEYPTPSQIKELHIASAMGVERAKYRREGTSLVFDIVMEPHSVTAIFMPLR